MRKNRTLDDAITLAEIKAAQLRCKEEFAALNKAQRLDTYRHNNLIRGLNTYELAFDNLNCTFQDSPLRVNSHRCLLHVQNDHFWYRLHGEAIGQYIPLPDTNSTISSGLPHLNNTMRPPNPVVLRPVADSSVADTVAVEFMLSLIHLRPSPPTR